MAKRVRERGDLQEEKQQQSAGIDGKIKDVSEIIRTVSEIIATGTEDRAVESTRGHDSGAANPEILDARQGRW